MREPINFLLVEDDDDHANLVIRNLRKAQAANTIHHVSNGAEALSFLRREGPHHATAPRPDVVLLDLKLPKVGGHEVLAAIKEDPDLKAIPVVVLTTSGTEADCARAYDNHANSYLVKPVDFDKFRQMVEELSLYWGVWNAPPPRE